MKRPKHYRFTHYQHANNLLSLLWVALLALLLSGCFSTGRYSQRHDSAPKRAPGNVTTQDASPIFEPYNPANLRSYKVLGKRYYPLETGKGYTAKGEASWYGQKFHGYLTANGEIYNMYHMSAAHKTLPIPSYVKVTNVENQKSVVVRVNDRGPFHDKRLIDLSYAAALKIDMLKTGTAKVQIDVIHIDENGMMTVGNGETFNPTIPVAPDSVPAPPLETEIETATELAQQKQERAQDQQNSEQRGLYIQVTALSDAQKIDSLAKGLTMLYQVPSHTPSENGIYRLRLGPLLNEQAASKLLNELKASGYSSAYKLYDAIQGARN